VTGVSLPGEPPPRGIRIAAVPREQIVIHDNWNVAGLRRSGSSDYGSTARSSRRT
jgi:hypothetical protein